MRRRRRVRRLLLRVGLRLLGILLWLRILLLRLRLGILLGVLLLRGILLRRVGLRLCEPNRGQRDQQRCSGDDRSFHGSNLGGW